MAKPLVVGTPIRVDLGTGINPTNIALPADFPSGANAAVIFTGGTDDSSLAVTSMSSNFTGAIDVSRQIAANFQSFGICAGVGAVTATGSGRTLTVQWNVAPPYGPECVVVPLQVDDPNDFAGPGATARLAGSVVAVNPTGANDLVLAAHIVYGDTAPAVPAGGTNVWVSPGPIRDTLIRVSSVPTVTPTTSVTMPAGDYAAMVVVVFKDKGGSGADETRPTLVGSISETGKTENSISISWPAGSDNVGVAGYDVSSNGGSSWTQLGNVLSHTFSSLSSGTEYQIRVRARDAAGNTSDPPLSTAITTTAPDTTDPTLTGSITVGTKTATSIAMSWPAGSDNVGVTSYEVSSNAGSSWTDVGNVLSHTFTSLAALTSYGLRVRAKDAAGNVSAALAATTSTYRAGDTAANIRANTGPIGGAPAGALYEFADGKASGAWLSYRTVSGPTPSGGTLDAQPDGRFTYFGPDAAIWVIQPEMNGADEGEPITIELYDQSTGPGPWSDWESVGGSVSLPQLYNVLGSLPAGSYEVQIRAVRGGNNSAESDTKTVDL